MSSKALVRRKSTGQLGLRPSTNATIRSLLRLAAKRKSQIVRRDKIGQKIKRMRARDRKNWKKGSKKYKRIVGNAAGTTYTTNRMIVHKTPREQRFLRKMFKNGSNVVKHVNRFGFNWLGAVANNKTIWYSVTHLKFNNVYDNLSAFPTDI